MNITLDNRFKHLQCLSDSQPNVYIAGPMSGYPQFNSDAFRNAEDRIRSETSWNPINPFVLDQILGSHPEADLETGQCSKTAHQFYMRRDLSIVPFCDAICLLEGWENSPGAKSEVGVAIACGIPVLQYSGNLESLL